MGGSATAEADRRQPRDGRGELVARLRDLGYRITPQRMAVIQALTAPGAHPTADEVLGRVRSLCPMTSPATVLRTITCLQALGEVRAVPVPGDEPRFDAHGLAPHPHALCARCRRLVDLEGGDTLAALGQRARRADFCPAEVVATVLGTCAACRRESTDQGRPAGPARGG